MDHRDTHAITLGNNLTDAAILILAENGMEKLFPTEFREWTERGTSIRKNIASQNATQKVELDAKIEGIMKTTRISIREAMLKRVAGVYPYVSVDLRDALSNSKGTRMLDLSELLNEHGVSDAHPPADTTDDSTSSVILRIYID